MTRSLLLVLLLSLLGLVVATGCIDPLNPDLDDSPRTLVVDGLITNGPGPHEVKLSRSGAFEQSLEGIDSPVQGAEVFVRDDAGTEVRLVERKPQADPGTYTTAEGDLVGTVGRSYTLQVSLPDGSTYTSNPEEMRPVPEIDTIIVRPSNRLDGGLDALVGFDEPETPGQAYRWDSESIAAFGILVSPSCTPPNVVPDACFFRDSKVAGIVNVTDDQLINGQSVLQPVRTFVPESEDLRLAYAMRVQQQSLTPEAYEFWNAIREQIENNGTTFSNPPARIQGNLRNPDDPTDVALGYFQVSAISEITRCIKPSDFPSFTRNPAVPCSSCRGQRSEATTTEPEARTEICPPLEGGPGGPTEPPTL
jgi:hypothetical protein